MRNLDGLNQLHETIDTTLTQLADWLDDQNLIAKPAHAMIRTIRTQLIELYKEASFNYTTCYGKLPQIARDKSKE